MAEDGDGSTIPDSWEEFDNDMLDKKVKEISLSDDTGTQRTNHYNIIDPNERTSFQPQVRILKRNSETGSSSGRSSRQTGVTKPTKTLEQREAEYAQARLRIMGAAYNPSETEDTLSQEVPRPFARSNVNNDSDIPSIAVLRQPKGPDGSKGFQQPSKR